MSHAPRWVGAAVVLALELTWGGVGTLAQGTPKPRPGLSAQQTKEAIGLAEGALRDLRKNATGATGSTTETRDAREYVVSVEMLASQAGGPKAVVTSYRYADDATVFVTVDLGTGRVVGMESAQHLRTPLSDAEYEYAKALAREQSDEVKKLYERFGDQISVYPQFSQFLVKNDPRIHRVVHLTYRVGTRDLSYPRPIVDLTMRRVDTPAPEPESKAPPRRR
jgi:hypothetical protein